MAPWGAAVKRTARRILQEQISLDTICTLAYTHGMRQPAPAPKVVVIYPEGVTPEEHWSGPAGAAVVRLLAAHAKRVAAEKATQPRKPERITAAG